MFVILDTNHYQELVYKTEAGQRLQERIARSNADVFTTAVTAQEVLQGWISSINRKTAGRDQVNAYEMFIQALRALETIIILPFDEMAASAYHSLPTKLRRIGTMDLKIAAITMSHDSLLLSRNLTDFQQVPGLKVANWLD
jgi:tRNA(fMet)-specific endonuclease VapC